MRTPINKNKNWIACLHESIGRLDQGRQLDVMRPAGEACAAELLHLCEKYLGKPVNSIDELVTGWNLVRDKRGLEGRWEFEGDTLRGTFKECGCPLVRSGLIELHLVQCYCSQGMMNAIFSKVSGKSADVKIVRSIGRGDDVCDFLIKT